MMQTREKYKVKTGTLLPPYKGLPRSIDFEKVYKRCKKMCKELRMDILVYCDERDGVSVRPVRNANIIRLPKDIVKVFWYNEIKNER